MCSGPTSLPAVRADGTWPRGHGNMSGDQFSLTFLNMTSEITADAVKSAAIIIIMIPTGMFLLRPVRDEIQPLKNSKSAIRQVSQCTSQKQQ